MSLDSVNVSDSVTITMNDNDDDDSATDYRPSLHQFADVLCSMPLPFPVERQDEDIVLTNYIDLYIGVICSDVIDCY